MTRHARTLWFGVGWLAWSAAARAAGGHFDVDDATVLEPGHCQYETWLTRAPSAAPSATLFHLGPACRVGPVELGVNVDHWSSGAESRSSAGPQLKWVVDPLVGGLSAGLAWSASYDLKRGGRPAQIFYVPLTWAVNDTLALNANLGADWDSEAVRTRRVGASAEWIVNKKLTLIGERLKFSGAWTSRLGTRFMLSDAISVDFSAARFGPRATRVYAIGLNHDFVR